MKKYFTLLTILSLCYAIQAQNFQIFRTTADVQVYQNKQWVSAQKRMPIALSDSVKITSNGILSLLNTQNNQIIELKKAGTYCVKKAVDASLNESANILAQTTQNIANAVATTGKSKNYNIYGATMRSELSTIETNHRLVFQLLSIVEQIQKGKLPKQSKLIALHTHVNDSIQTFSIENKDKKAYVVNILRIPKSGKPTFCLNLNKTDSEYFFYLIGDQSTISLPNIPFAVDDATYVLIATPEIFDASWLEIALCYPPQTNPKKKLKLEVFTVQ